mmetsp:Transcript_51262/g.111462  ORF Transcript_51262/g.111462 Transcript_51262/m.111462 type:complete len:141 (-) Transcript_51262:162-584(-)
MLHLLCDLATLLRPACSDEGDVQRFCFGADAAARVEQRFMRHEYRLTSPSLYSKETLLNGQLLVAEADGHAGALPPLRPRVVAADDDDTAAVAAAATDELGLRANQTGAGDARDNLQRLVLEPLSLNFFMFPNANSPLCM